MNCTQPAPAPPEPEGPEAAGSKPSATQPAPLLVLVVGSVLLVIGVVWTSRTAGFAHRAVKVPGTIVSVEAVQSKKTTGHFPVFTFTDPSGLVRTQRSRTGFGASLFHPGQKIMVFCDPADPENARIESGLGLWFEPVGLTAFAVFMTGLGAFRLRRARRAAVVAEPESAA